MPLARAQSAVVAALRGREPTSAADLAQLLGLHVNTTRFHLDRLVAAGVVERHDDTRVSPGRPRVLFGLTASGSGTGPRAYRLLSDILIAALRRDRDGAASVARDAGHAWGASLTGARRSRRTPQAVERLRGILAQIGFAPSVRPGDTSGETVVELTHCPFLESALAHPDVVCGIHAGLIEGVLDGLGTPLDLGELVPFATPTSCVARLRGSPA